MTQLVLIGEGRGETGALPVLVRKLLRETTGGMHLPLREGVLRWPFPIKKEMDCRKWIDEVELASRFSGRGAVLAVYDGDIPKFPPGSSSPFCAKVAARAMAKAAVQAGAGTTCSLAVVFACVEFETWLIAGWESLVGKEFPGGRIPLLTYPSGERESHGKSWLERNLPGYRPSRDQKVLTELLDLQVVRPKKLRSFARLESAVEQIVGAMNSGKHVCTPS